MSSIIFSFSWLLLWIPNFLIKCDFSSACHILIAGMHYLPVQRSFCGTIPSVALFWSLVSMRRLHRKDRPLLSFYFLFGPFICSVSLQKEASLLIDLSLTGYCITVLRWSSLYVTSCALFLWTSLLLYILSDIIVLLVAWKVINGPRIPLSFFALQVIYFYWSLKFWALGFLYIHYHHCAFQGCVRFKTAASLCSIFGTMYSDTGRLGLLVS